MGPPTLDSLHTASAIRPKGVFENAVQRILVVDDEPDILEALKLLLEGTLDNVLVRTAVSGPDALGVLKAEPMNLVISDYKMPGMDGLEFLREMQQVAPHVPRILMTAYPDLEVALRAIRETSIENFVTKPFDTAHFLYVVASILYERRAAELKNLALARAVELLSPR